MRTGRLSRIVAIVLVTVAGSSAWGQSPQSLPPVNLGFTSFLDGAPPAGSGLYFSQYNQLYSADRLMDANGGKLPLPDPDLDVWVSLSQFIYMWDSNVQLGDMELPAKPALDVIIPFISPNLDFDAPLPLTANGSGLGDILIGPALQFDPIMGENGPKFVHRIEAQFNIPTGLYNKTDIVNPGANFFSFNPYWAGTVFLSPKDTVSFRAHYLWCAENNDPSILLGPGVTSTRAGDAFHINFAAEHEVIEKKLRVGVNGYYLKQTTDAQVNGFDVAGSREQVLGIGPGAILSFSQTKHVFCNLYWETEAENRPEGFKLNMRYVQKF